MLGGQSVDKIVFHFSKASNRFIESIGVRELVCSESAEDHIKVQDDK